MGEVIIHDPNPLVLGEIGFLEREFTPQVAGEEGGPDVGRIDQILVARERQPPLAWCALEKQAVYFSGDSMSVEWEPLRTQAADSLPFPAGKRRPDYRSSGPKRLMPQLQIKVPTLRRWGKKMAVIVDEDFFDALGPMEDVGNLSNCDVAWFVVRYDEGGPRARLTPGHVRFTTLERAVEGLTAGRPVTLELFEERILQKLRSARPG